MIILDNLLKTKLTSLLNPWLVEELDHPTWEIHVGLFRSVITAKHLRFNTAALNREIFNGDDDVKLVFKSVVINEISFHISHWSSPAFSLYVNGLTVTLHPKEGAPVRVTKRVEKELGEYVRERKKKLVDEIDPEGSSFHDCLEKKMMATLSKIGMKDSLVNLVLKHCCLQLHDVSIRVEIPVTGDKISWLCHAKELKAESSEKEELGCFFAGFVGLLFWTVRETAFDVEANLLEIRAEKRNYNTSVISCVNPCVGIRLKDLSVVNFMLSVPEMNISFSPCQIHMMGAFRNLLRVATKHVRSGRLLWEIARSKIHNILLPQGYVLHRVFLVAVFWLRLVREYQVFLEVVGFTIDERKMSNGLCFPKRAKKLWIVISETEEALPAEAVASARKVARYRAAVKESCAENIPEISVRNRFNGFKRLFLPLAVIWGLLLWVFTIIISCFRTFKTLPEDLLDEPEASKEVIDSRKCIRFGKISASISAVDPNCQLTSRNSYSDLRTFVLCMKEVLYVCQESVYEQNMSFSVGSVKVISLPTFVGSGNRSKYSSVAEGLEGYFKGEPNDSKTVIWVEPALTCSDSENDMFEAAARSFSNQMLEEMELIQNSLRLMFQGIDDQYDVKPWAVGDIRIARVHVESPDSGFLKCILMVGKLNSALGYLSVSSVATLTGNVQQALCQFDDSECQSRPAHSPKNFLESQKRDWSVDMKSRVKELTTSLFGLLPDKHVELRVLVSGPKFQISLGNKDQLSSSMVSNIADGSSGLNLTINFHDSYFAVWPSSKSEVASHGEHQRLGDLRSELTKLREPMTEEFIDQDRIVYASKGQILLSYFLRFGGFTGYFEDSLKHHSIQFLSLKSVTAEIMSLRDHVHSFGKSVFSNSLLLCGDMAGGTGLFYEEELSVILQVAERLLSAASIPATAYTGASSSQNRQWVTQHRASSMETSHQGVIIEGNERAASDSESALFSVSASFEVAPFDIKFHNSRHGLGKKDFSPIFDEYNFRNPGLGALPDSGIWLSFQKTCIDISVGELKAELDSDFQGCRAVTFRYRDEGANGSKPESEDASQQAIDCLHELSLSNFTCNLVLAYEYNSEQSSRTDDVRSSNNPEFSLRSSSLLTTNGEGLNSETIQEEVHEPDVLAVAESSRLLMHITVDVIYMGTCYIKNSLLRAHPSDKLVLSLSVGGDFRSLNLSIQGGFIFLEATVIARFYQCFTAYLHCLRSLLHVDYQHRNLAGRATPDTKMSMLDNNCVQELDERRNGLASPVKPELFDVLTMNLSQVSVVLLAADESGGIKEIIGKFDFSLTLGSENMKRKFLIDLCQMVIVSKTIDGAMGYRDKYVEMPHFSSLKSSYESLWSNHEDSASAVFLEDNLSNLSEIGSSSVPSSSVDSSSASTSPPASEMDGNYILERLTIFISAERNVLTNQNPQSFSFQGWVGIGSITGLNLTISLSEIQMFMAAAESLSEISGNSGGNVVEGRSWPPSGPEPEKDVEANVPDGAIIAIQDVNQHMYVTVESEENKYKVAGTLHYSLSGKRALFRVKWQKRRWNFSSSWFSLISLYAKSDNGDPLCLNYSASSSFVDISGSNENASVLWKYVACELDNYENDADLGPLNILYRTTFYLVNKKNGCGAAFVDGALEFVKKPGSLFKFKVFDSLTLTRNPVSLESDFPGVCDLTHLDGQNDPDRDGIIPSIILTVGDISLTVVHELSDANNISPLLQGSMNSAEVVVQILPHKTRVMSKLRLSVQYYDVHKFLWRELVYPVEVCIYWRSKLHSQGEIFNNGTDSYLYARTKELNIALTEPSLDILLYVVGKLDFAGPFAVKSCSILGNCCKVENHSQLHLHCSFYDSQAARVGGRQSGVFFLRHLADQPSKASYATFRLEAPEISSTSSIDVPLAKNQIFAWRTRIKSLHDPRTYPGPFIVFDISKTAEEVLTVSVSPLLRICNGTGFPVEMRIQRLEQMEAESASVLLREGETVDDCVAAFDAVNLSGGARKALLSMGVGNFVFSFRPQMKGNENNQDELYAVDWSENLKGGKAVRLSGVIDKLSYKVRKALSEDSMMYSFTTASCCMKFENVPVTGVHFLVASIGREVPISQPREDTRRSSSVALLEQKEIFLLPTIRVFNLLESDIDILLTETATSSANGLQNINQATVSCGLAADLYANPAVIYFIISLAMFGSRCKPVDCGQWLKKLSKKKEGIQFLDIDLEFCGGKYFACLRLTRGERGILEAYVFTHYSLKNDTDFNLFCATPNLKPLSRDDARKCLTANPPHFGSFLPPKSVRSWFMKSSKLRVELLDEETSDTILDLDALSGLAEISFTKVEDSGFRQLVKLGVSLGPLPGKTAVPSQMVSIVPRYVISNDSGEPILVRQCFVQDESEVTISINSKEKAVLLLRVGSHDRKEVSVFDKLLRKHKIPDDDTSMFVQFRPNESGLDWSGPVCVASLGHFFLKFRRTTENRPCESDLVAKDDGTNPEFAAVHVVEEASTFVLHFHRPPDTSLPYRIENHLDDASVTYYQKDSLEPETLASGGTIDYVWDDMTRPHKLMVKINGINMLREISLDKLRPWKPFFRLRQQGRLAIDLPLDGRMADRDRTSLVGTNGFEAHNTGYLVYADGPTRVLRICDSSRSEKHGSIFQSCKKICSRIPFFAVRLLEQSKQVYIVLSCDGNIVAVVDSLQTPKSNFGLWRVDYFVGLSDSEQYDLSTSTPIVVARVENINLNSIFIGQQKYNQLSIESINVDEKWTGAPFAAMLRRHLTSNSVIDDCVLFVIFVLYPTSSNVREVKYSSIVLQPIDMNLDEETLMRIVPFWRKSLSSNTQSQQYYFDHFEIHPIKIIANFLPSDSYSSYTSGQEMLRSLLHSVIKVPTIKNMAVELNGVLVTHALVTSRELLLRCAQHYSWYAMRAIYIAKGSRLLPPTFASVFDDLASSSLDVFFDPSSSLFNVRGLTLGTFKLISKCIKTKGFSGTKRYFGDLSKTLQSAGSNILFAALTEISDSILKGAESNGLNGMVTGFHHGILKLAMDPSLVRTAFMEGGPDRKIILDRSPGVDEFYVEGYLQAMLDTIYQQEYLRVRVIDNQVIIKNLPPNSSLIGEIVDRVKDFLVSKALLKGDSSTRTRPLRHLRGENEWRIGPTVLTLCEHLFVSFAIRMLRKQTNHALGNLRLKEKWIGASEQSGDSRAAIENPKGKLIWKWGVGRFVLSAMVAYVDGRLCRHIPHPVARRIVSGFLLSFLDNKD